MAPAHPVTQLASSESNIEETMTRQHEMLAMDESLRTLINAMPELVMVVGPARRILLGNRTLANFAATHGNIDYIGMRPGEFLSCQHGKSAPAGCGTGEACRICGATNSILGALEGNLTSHECRILRDTPNGFEALDFKVSSTPFNWQGESLVLVVATDISDEKRRKSLEHIFFHDLLNTAGVISGVAELLAKGILDFEETKEGLLEKARTLVREIQSQRDLLAAENNELVVVPTPLHSTIFLESMVHTYSKTPLALEHEILLAPGLEKTIFYSDERLLARVVGNLVKNALEASPPGGAVTLGCSVEGKQISFWCNNNGVIPQEIQLQIFHRSFSTKEPGRGVGTYSVKLLTERYLKGRVSFSSNREEGTTFTVTYPIELTV